MEEVLIIPLQISILPRAFRVGNWAEFDSLHKNQSRGFYGPNQGGLLIGFRVASLTSEGGGEVPEPSSMVIGALLGLGGVLARKRLGSRCKSQD